MRKFLFLFFIFSVGSGAFAPDAFAQFSWRLDIDVNTGLMGWTVPTGEKSEEFLWVNGSQYENDAINNPLFTGTGDHRGDYTWNKGSLYFFSYDRGDLLRSNALRFTLDYTESQVQLHTRSLLDLLINRVVFETDDDGLSLIQLNEIRGERSPALWDILRYSFDEWHLQGNILFLYGRVGNTPDRGKVKDYSDAFTDDLLRLVKVDYYGINTPAPDAGFSGNGQDANNFRSRPSIEPGTVDSYDWVMPYFMMGARLDMSIGSLRFPFNFQIAADPGNNTGVGGRSDAALNLSRINASVRLSFEEIAKVVTLDALYRIRGGDPFTLELYDETDNPEGNLQPDGTGATAHVFGLYANILNIPNLGIGFGYSGYTVAYEATQESVNDKKITRTGPLYNGIDLQFQFTGIPNITITSVNNVSFAAIKQSTNTAVSVGLLGSDLNNYTAQSWIGLYNALGLDIKVTDRFSASFQIANRYGLITSNEANIGVNAGFFTTKKSQIRLGGGGTAIFHWRNMVLQGGVTFFYENNSYYNDASGAQDNFSTRNAAGGNFIIAVPLRLYIFFTP